MFLNIQSLLLQKVEHEGRATQLHKTGAEKSERRREYEGKLQKYKDRNGQRNSLATMLMKIDV